MTWFWIITLTWGHPAGQATGTVAGTTTPEQSAVRTRYAAYPIIIDAGRRGMGIPDGMDATVLFFSLEPDAMDAAVPEPAHTAGGVR
jgi:hypothetical protein